MAIYIYKVKDETGRALYGVMDVPTKKDVKRRLVNTDLFYISAEPFHLNRLFRKGTDLQALTMFTHRLTSLVEAGIPILPAMNILWRQTEDKTMQLVICYLKLELEDGNRISDAMGNFPRIFPPVYRALIRVAEIGGALVQVLRKLTEYLEHQAQIVTRTKKALFYPLIVVAFSILVTIGMFTFVVPTFEKILLKLNIDLPLITQMIIKLSHLLRSWIFWASLAAGVLILIVFYRRFRYEPHFALIKDKFIYNFPHLGRIMFLISLSRFVRSLSVLLGAGIPIMESLDVAKSTSANQLIIANLDKIKRKIESGGSLYHSFKEVNVFPVMMIEMLGVGESSGMLVKVLEKLTKHFDEEIDYEINKFLTILEPFLIIVIGAVVLLTLLAVYMPIVTIWQGLTR